MSDFRRLLVWQKAHDLALTAHRTASRIRGGMHAPLRGQMMRAAMSIPANIVEGRGQTHEKEFARFLRIALNSSNELEYHLIAARDTGAISSGDFTSMLHQVVEVRKMLYGLLNRIARGRAQPLSQADRRPPAD